MKLKFKLFIFFAGLFISAQAEEYTREVHSSYLKSQIQALDISNKFGTITINDFGGDSVVVDAVITVENATEKRAEYLLGQIQVSIRKVGNSLNIETSINEDFKTKENFSIDYTINIPADRDLAVTNKFGNVVLNNLNANGQFNISYGNINTGTLEAPDAKHIKMDIAYGKADIESANRMQAEIKYSKLFLREAKSLNIISKYSGLNISEIGELVLESKYDGVDIEEIKSLKANSKYTNYNIEELGQRLLINTEYGSVRIKEVTADFESIELTNSYGGIEIGLGNKNYFIDASCDYCDIKYPEDKFKGNREKRNNNFYLRGNIGAESNKKVLIKSRYGGIKLRE